MKKSQTFYSAIAALLMSLVNVSTAAAQPDTGENASSGARPNVVFILTDDMGYSDLGCYGSEIQTPNLDAVASDGVRFSQFYNTSRCSPTRSSLMTGLYSHQAGMGLLTTDEGQHNPGFRGRLMERCVTIAEVLGPQGYHCLVTGKWHMGDAKKAWWPLARGFDRFYGCPQGGGFFFRPSSWKQERHIVRGNQIIYDKQNDPPKGWYATDAFTDEGIKYVQEAVEANKPFFWYLAYNAPHFPLQAKPEDIAKYRGKYLAGWDKIRQARYEKLIELGLIDKTWKLSPRDEAVPAWNSLTEQQKDAQDERMAIYAGMIDCVDQNVGKIVTALKQMGLYDNTLIVFLHDNGGDVSGGPLGKNQQKGTPGTAESLVHYGKCWANVSDVPFRKHKGLIHEGGTSTPLIAHWPDGIDASMAGKIATEPAHLIDLMATVVEISEATYPERFKGHEIIPMEGESLLPILKDQPFHRDAPICFEHSGNKGIRLGKWKLVAFKGKSWELYDMQADRTELNDLAAQMPDKVTAMSQLYQDWADRCFVEKVKKPKRKTKKLILRNAVCAPKPNLLGHGMSSGFSSGRLRLVAGNRTTGTKNLRDGRWHHVAAVAMAGPDGPTILLYVDGQLEQASRDSEPTPLKTKTNHRFSEPIQFGRHLFADDMLLRGAIDEVYIFGEALSGNDIRQLFQAQ